MKVKEILITAAELSGRRDLADFLAERGFCADANESAHDAELLLRCYNLTENEIALDYLPLLRTQTMHSDGTIAYGSFEQPPVEIIGVRNGRGFKEKFSLEESGIVLPVGEFSITYSYRPAVKKMNDAPQLNRKGDARLLALGTASEFSLMNGSFDTASLLDKRYRDALACACRERGGRLKMRCWI